MRKFLLVPFLLAVFACGSDGSSLTSNGDACEESLECESFALDEEKGGCWQELVSYDFFQGEVAYILDNGLCSVECEANWDGTEEEAWRGTCGDTELCLVYGSSESICFQECTSDLPCREDYECFELSHGVSTCLPPMDATRVVNGDLKITQAVPTVTK